METGTKFRGIDGLEWHPIMPDNQGEQWLIDTLLTWGLVGASETPPPKNVRASYHELGDGIFLEIMLKDIEEHGYACMEALVWPGGAQVPLQAALLQSGSDPQLSIGLFTNGDHVAAFDPTTPIAWDADALEQLRSLATQPS